MPTWRNMPSMPNVRVSSETIGTRRGPTTLSRISAPSAREYAIVVENSRSPLSSSSALNASSFGTGSGASTLRRRTGNCPPSAASRSRRYFISGLFSSGRIVRDLLDLFVRDRNRETVAERAQLVFGELLRVVRDVLAFARRAEAVALDRFWRG